MESYSAICGIYDDINKSVDYSAFADLYERCFSEYMSEKPVLVLDLACGTGAMTEELDKRGYDMTGIDLSFDMLCIAKDRAYEKERQDNILYLCQNMTEFELYGTVDACVCTLDGINYLTEDGDLEKTFSCVHNYLIPDGIFVFDINGRYKFENIYADNTFSMEEEWAVCIWENFYDTESKICDFYITLFKECADGRYERYDENQSERMYTLAEIKASLERCNMEFLYALGDLDFSPGSDECERIYIVCKCRK